jgi:hypothetical protein
MKSYAHRGRGKEPGSYISVSPYRRWGSLERRTDAFGWNRHDGTMRAELWLRFECTDDGKSTQVVMILRM